MPRTAPKQPRRNRPARRTESPAADESYLCSLNSLIVQVAEFNRRYDELLDMQESLTCELERIRKMEAQRIRQQRFRDKQSRSRGQAKKRYLDDDDLVCPECGQ